MPWIPAVTIDGGMYGGRTYPDGDLTGFFSYMENVQTSSHGILGVKQSGTSTAWSGKFGLQSDLVTQYWRDHLDGQMHEFILAEIVVENPEGAQYYKQSIVYTCRTKANAAVHRTKTIEGVVYEADTSDVEFGIISVKRYEYATPYSTPTATQLVSGFRGFAARYKLSGDDEALSGNNILYRGNDFIIPIGFGSYDGKLYHICGDYVNMPYTHGALEGLSVEYWNEQWGPVEIEVPEDPNEDPNNPGDEEEGGDGEHNRPVTPIPVPEPRNGLTAATSGFITMYRLERQQMLWFADDMYTDTLWDAIKLFFGNPIDFIVGCMILPYHPDVDEAFYPQFGPLASQTFSHSFLRVSAQYKQFDFGSIYLEEYGKNCFDYSPYTKIMIWLPYIGYRELPTDEVMGKNVGVKYTCDALSGDCVAFVTTQVKPQGLAPFAEVVIAQFTGNCGVQVPFGQVSFDNFIRSSFEGGASGVVGIGQAVSGNIPASASQLAESTVGYITGLKPTVERGGLVGGSSGFNSIQYPYIIRTFPKQSLPSNYKEINGYPSNIGGKLSDGFDGLAVVEDIQLNNIPALEEERKEIMEFLREGVII